MSTPGNQSSPGPSAQQYTFNNGNTDQSYQQGNGATNYLQQNQQQHYMQNMDHSTSSPIPGASGGGGDPGPSSMAQQQQQQQQHGGFRPQLQQQQTGLTPQQMAMFQQYSQGQAGQQRQLTPQQLQIAMANIQAQNQGGNVNPQALMAAMRAGQQGQQGTPGQTTQQLPQRPPPSMGNYGQASQGTPGAQQPNPGQLAFQQQRIAQLMQQQQAMMARPSPGPGSPNRPSQQQPQNGSMPPPPLPGTPQQFQQQQGSQQMQQPGQFHLSQHQQQLFASQRQNLLNNPTFMALPIQQQQAYMATQQQQFFRMVASGQIPASTGQPQQSQPQLQQPPPHQQQPQYAQMQPSQHQPPPRPESAQGMAQSDHQSPAITRQPTPQQIGTPHSTHSQTPQQPMSSLPQHMAPPRPASAASQRAPSPHQVTMPSSPAVMGSMSTPPPSGPSYQINTPHTVNAPSPTHSNHSHHSHHSQHHQTPQPHAQSIPQSLHTASPMPARTPTPNQSLHAQQYSGTPVEIGINGQSSMPQQYHQQSQSWQPQPQSQGTAPVHSSPAQNPQQMPQMSLEAIGHGATGPSGQSQSSSYGNYPLPPQPIVPTMENMTPQQQQQMATAMSFFSQAAQQQNAAGAGVGQGQGNVRPTMASRPTQSGSMAMPNINTSDFPFDPRLLQQIPFLSDTRWRSSMQTQNPQLLAAVQQAASAMPTLAPDVIQRMQAVLYHTAKIQASGAFRPPNGTPGLPPHMQQQFAQQGAPGFAPGAGAPAQNSISAAQQARLWAAQQGQNSPASTSSPSIRPPPPHLPPTSNTPASPTVTNSHPIGRPPGSGSKVKKEKDHPPTPSHQPSMPPPSFIPSHMISQRPPSRSAPRDIPPPTTMAHIPPPHVFPVKEWEKALRIDVPITKISPLPISDIDEMTDPTFKGQLLPMTMNEIANVKEWVKKDINYFNLEKSHHKKNLEKNMKWAQEEDRETPWWMLRKGEMRTPAPARLRILWPADKERMRSERTHRGRMQIKFSQADLKAMANVEDHVVPVRLELEHDTHKLKDTFMWNCADQIVTPELFAQTLCDDFAVPHVHFVPKIVAAISERVREYQDQVLPMVQRRTPGDKYRGLINEEDSKHKALMEVFRQAREREGSLPEQEEIKTDPGDEHQEDNIKIVSIDEDAIVTTDMDDLDRPMTVEEATACLPADQSEELRILIKVDIIVGTQNLSDSFEWDLNSTVSPEEFAASYVTELGLSLEFATAIAHDIHEQVLVHKRSLFLVGHTFGSGLVPDDEVRSAFLPPVTTTLRREDVAMSSFTPIFNELREEDIAHIEATRDKEAKRKKRAGRARRGVVLPDREPLKTQRSLLNNLGPNGLPTLTMTETASVAVAYNSNTSTKRKAALDAQANINLLAQDLPIPQQPLSPAPSYANANANAHSHSQRGRKPRGRGGHMGLSRASPASDAFRDREGSISIPVQDGIITPSIPTIGIKRFREDSLDSSSINGNGGGVYHNSPIPGRKRTNHSRIPESPPTPSGIVKLEDHSHMGMSLELLEGDPAIGWHCTHCGVPEYLAGKVKKDKLGNKLLCYQCSEHQAHKGKPRPCTYHEDEQVHRDRLMRRKGGIPPIPSASALASTSTLFPGSGASDSGLHPHAHAQENQNQNSMAMAIPSVLNPNANPIATSNLGSISVPHPHSLSNNRSVSRGRSKSKSRSRSKSTTTTTSVSNSRSRSPIKRRKTNLSDDSDDDDDDDDDEDSDSTFASSRDRDRDRDKKKLPHTPSRVNVPLSGSHGVGVGGLGKSPLGTGTNASPNSTTRKSTNAIELPIWIINALTLMRSKYPRDEFSVVQKPQPPGQGPIPVEWRAKCLDCPGKIYSLGPGESLNNFEVHLKNRQHTANRLAREGKTS